VRSSIAFRTLFAPWLSVLALSAMPWSVAQTDPAYQWNDQGIAAVARGEYKEAEVLYRKAMERWRALGPGHDAHFAVTEMNLAEAQCGQGRRKECEKSLEDSLSIFRRTLGVRNEHTLSNMNLLAGVALMIEDVDYAEKLFNEALPIEREYFPNSIQLARTLGGLAGIRTQQSKPGEALGLAEEALKLTLVVDGEASVDAALEYNNVAEIHRIAGRFDRAGPLYLKAKVIYEKLLGSDHPRVGAVLSEEGLLFMSEHKYALAEQALLSACQIMDKSCPNCGFEQSMTLTNLGLLRLRQERFTEADRLLTKALAIQEQYMQKPGPTMVDTLEALAQVLRYEHRFEEAERMKSRAALILGYR
jgi:tetratricopeptide (TPR) repeat protein